MRKAVRAIILHDGKLVVMHRNKFGKEYDTLPGGDIEMGETPEQTLLREVEEETSVKIGDYRLVFIEDAGFWGMQHIYLCEYVSGEPKLRDDSIEMAINKLGNNIHEAMWRPLDELEDTPFFSDNLKQRILLGVKNGFPEQPESFATQH
jgi:8-oxo-dGTP pyrophosphatase MutT (NUDIX family)